MSDLENLIWHRQFYARVMAFECSPEYVFKYLEPYGYTLIQIKEHYNV